MTRIPTNPTNACYTHLGEQARDGLPQVVDNVAAVDDKKVAQARRVPQHQHRHRLSHETQGGELAAGSDQRAIDLKEQSPRG